MLKDFIIPLFMVCIGEMGDKTQLVALTFATRFNAKIVLLSIFVATLLLDFLSVGLGQLIVRFVGHIEYVTVVAGLAFLGFAVWTLKEEGEEEKEKKTSSNPFFAVFATFFFAEIGDKTMLTTVTMSTQYNPFLCWFGAILGMMIADGLAIYIGMKLGKLLPEKIIKIFAFILFLLFGVFYIYKGIVSII